MSFILQYLPHYFELLYSTENKIEMYFKLVVLC